MIRMLIVGYVFAIRSERALCRDVRVNLAYRWFCGLSKRLGDKAEKSDAWQLRALLSARRERPRSRTAEQRDELAAGHSISSSARPDSGSGTVMPSALALFRFRKSSTLVACWTGRSAG